MITTLKQYRIMDITLLGLLAVVTEIMGAVLHLQFPGAGYYLSFGVLIGLIAIIRWGPVGSIVYIAAGIPMILLGNGSMMFNIFFYPVANSIIIVMGFLIRRISTRKVVKDNLILLIFVAVAYVLLAIGKGLVLGIYGGEFLKGSIIYFITQLFSLVMTYIIFLLIRKRDGLLMDMKMYFEREQE